VLPHSHTPPDSIGRRVGRAFVRLLGLALFVAVPALALGVVYGGAAGPTQAVEFAVGEDPYADGLRITDRRVDDPRVMVGTSPLYDGQDEAAALLNDWQRADNPNYFAAR
jgi:hypothetical protein